MQQRPKHMMTLYHFRQINKKKLHCILPITYHIYNRKSWYKKKKQKFYLIVTLITYMCVTKLKIEPKSVANVNNETVNQSMCGSVTADECKQ